MSALLVRMEKSATKPDAQIDHLFVFLCQCVLSVCVCRGGAGVARARVRVVCCEAYAPRVSVFMPCFCGGVPLAPGRAATRAQRRHNMAVKTPPLAAAAALMPPGRRPSAGHHAELDTAVAVAQKTHKTK